jgi:hypothetical protein
LVLSTIGGPLDSNVCRIGAEVMFLCNCGIVFGHNAKTEVPIGMFPIIILFNFHVNCHSHTQNYGKEESKRGREKKQLVLDLLA